MRTGGQKQRNRVRSCDGPKIGKALNSGRENFTLPALAASKKAERSALMDLNLQVRREEPPHPHNEIISYIHFQFVFLNDAHHVSELGGDEK